jgi:S1-C subfamily serine protease
MKTATKSIFALTLAVIFSLNATAKNNPTLSNILDVELGVEFSPMSDDGVIGLSISRVFANSVGEAMGLEPNDVLLGIGNQPIAVESLDDALASYQPGDDVLLRIKRNGQYKEINVKMPDLNASKEVKGYLGVDVMPIASKNAVGAKINYVSQNSTADIIGLNKGDVIMGVNNQPVIGNNMASLMEGLNAGEVATVNVIRNGKNEVIKTVLGSAPKNFANSVL